MRRRIDDGTKDIATYVHHTKNADGTHCISVENVQDVAPILERNKQAQRYYRENPQKGEIREVAEIPNIFAYKMLNEHGVNIWDKSPESRRRLRKLLDSNEYKFLRTDPMKLGDRGV